MNTRIKVIATLFISLYLFVGIKSCFTQKLNIKRIVSDSVTSIVIMNPVENSESIILNDSLKLKFIELLKQSEYNSEINTRLGKNLARVYLTLNDKTKYTIEIISMFDSGRIAIIPYESNSSYYYNNKLGVFVQEIIKKTELIKNR